MVKVFNQLYITNETERFSFKSGHAMWVVKLIKEECYSKNFGLKQLYKVKVLEYKTEELNLYVLLCVPW